MNEIIVVAALAVPAAIGIAVVITTEARLRKMKLALLFGVLAGPASAMQNYPPRNWAGSIEELSAKAREDAMHAAIQGFLDDWLFARNVEREMARTSFADPAERALLEARVRAGTSWGQHGPSYRVYEGVPGTVYRIGLEPANGEWILLTVSRTSGRWKIVGYETRRGNLP